jgi:hypothetical protein
MGLGFLRGLRIFLVVLAFIIFGTAAYWVLDGSIFVGLALLFAIISGIAYGWALKAQATKRNIIKSNAVRYTCSLLLCAAWLFSRNYTIYWISGQYDRNNILGFAIDIGGFIMAFLVFLELIFAYRYERSSRALKRDAPATNIIIGPAPVQPEIQNTYYAPQQYVYGQAQQPGQPLMYYPQPAMTAPHQTLIMPYQDPNASHKIQL